MLRNFPNRIRLRITRIPRMLTTDLQDLYSGFLFHYEADKQFHNSRFFHAKTTEIKTIISQQNLPGLRKYRFFMAHILLELTLDRILVRDMPTVAHNFYDQLGKVEENVIGEFFRRNSLPAVSTEFFAYMNSFIGARYLYRYADNEGIIYALGRILQQVGLPGLNKDELQMLGKLAMDIETTVRTEYESIFKEIGRNR